MFEGLLQPTHLILILVILLVIFGPGKLAGLGQTLGSSIREFRGAVGTIDAPSNPVAPPAAAPVTETHAVAALETVAPASP